MRAAEFMDEDYLETPLELPWAASEHSGLAPELAQLLMQWGVLLPAPQVLTTPPEPLNLDMGAVDEGARQAWPRDLPSEICGTDERGHKHQTYVAWDPQDADGDGVVLSMEPATSHPRALLARCRAAEKRR